MLSKQQMNGSRAVCRYSTDPVRTSAMTEPKVLVFDRSEISWWLILGDRQQIWNGAFF